MTERELARRARHRLAVLRHAEEVSGNVAATRRYYGITRQCFYTWRRRYEAEGLDRLTAHGPGRSVWRGRHRRRPLRPGPPAPTPLNLRGHTHKAGVWRCSRPVSFHPRSARAPAWTGVPRGGCRGSSPPDLPRVGGPACISVQIGVPDMQVRGGRLDPWSQGPLGASSACGAFGAGRRGRPAHGTQDAGPGRLPWPR
ncbi:helix-turn-helix domain-containing protein [Streptomyces sp. Rer75]|uniref:helix-turn-helix domain-containing protein n=1 Tax=Streptomyces sp. Rer75 TaxID=2750011 RepID=UPI0015D09295|nr:helix-turn-helix domain-containing protein [Streptomyces sp. Rer75]QLH20575.1 helix-turn-helix domain-containing protein [Streptomyces sp. Rer75]